MAKNGMEWVRGGSERSEREFRRRSLTVCLSVSLSLAPNFFSNLHSIKIAAGIVSGLCAAGGWNRCGFNP